MEKYRESGATKGLVSALCLRGYASGTVKSLGGFRKGQHSVPDAVNATTTAFLARLCADELAEEAEKVFQDARTACTYKRKDITLSVSSPSAELTARDFSLEISYGFDGDDASCWRRIWTLTGFTELEFLRGEACETLFAGRFSELSFSLSGRGSSVEALIDAVEGLEDSPLRVDYPSDCAHCILRVEGVDAEVRFDGAELTMVFQQAGSPAALLDGFLAVREAFRLSRDGVLAGILGS